MVHEYFAYWDAASVALVLNWIAAIVGGDDYLGLVRTVGIIGLLACAAGVFARFRGEEFASYLIVFALLNGVILAPKITVNVIDLRTGSTFAVSNVPFGVGYFAAHMSRIGKWLTENFETIALPTEETRFSKTGFMFGARLVRENLSINIPPGALYSDLVDYIRYCVNPDLVDMPSIMDEMRVQTDLWSYLGGGVGMFSPNPGRYINVSTDSTGAVSCPGAYVVLSEKLKTTAIPGISDQLSKKLNAGSVNAGTMLSTQTPAFESMLFGTSRSAEEAIRQGVAMNMLIDGEASISSQLDDASGSKIAMAQSFRQANLSSSLMSEIAESALPKFRNAIELMIIGVFPVVALLILVAGVKGGLVFRSYLMTIVWVQLWAPMYALANFAGLNAMGVDFIGIGAGAALPTLGNMSEISSAAITGQTVAGVLALSTPAIAMALVKGGEAGLSGAVGSAMGSVTGGASQAAGAAASGNVSMGNVQWGNESYMNSSSNTISANKYQMAGAVESGGMATVSNENAAHTISTDGRVAATQVRGSSGGNLDGAASLDQGRTREQKSGNAAESAQTRDATISRAKSTVGTLLNDAGFTRAVIEAGSSGQGFTVGGSIGNVSQQQATTGVTNSQGGAVAVGEKFDIGSKANVGGDRSSSGEVGNTSQVPTMEHAPTSRSGGANAGQGTPGNTPANAPANSRAQRAVTPLQGDANNSIIGRAMTTAKAMFGASISGGATNSVAKTDSVQQARNSGFNSSSAEQLSTLVTASKQLAATTTDSQTRMKAERFSAALSEILSANQSESRRVTSSVQASDTVGDRSGSGVKLSQSLMPRAMEILNPSGTISGAMAAAKEIQAVTPKAEAAFRQAAEEQRQSQDGIGSQSAVAPAPKTVDQVAAQGNKEVDRFAKNNDGKVEAKHADNVAKSNAFGPALDTRSAPDGSTVEGLVQGTLGTAGENIAQQNRQQNVNAAVSAVANKMFKENNGALQTFANAYLGGLGYSSPSELTAGLLQGAVRSREFASQLESAGGKIRANGSLSDDDVMGLVKSLKKLK